MSRQHTLSSICCSILASSDASIQKQEAAWLSGLLQVIRGKDLSLSIQTAVEAAPLSASSADTVTMGAGRRESDSCSYHVKLIATEWHLHNEHATTVARR